MYSNWVEIDDGLEHFFYLEMEIPFSRFNKNDKLKVKKHAYVETENPTEKKAANFETKRGRSKMKISQSTRQMLDCSVEDDR